MWTWKCSGEITRNQRDYVLIERRFRNGIKSSKTYPGANCYSNHVPILSVVHPKIKKAQETTSRAKTQSRTPENRQIKNEFQITVKNNFQALQNISQTEKQWENLRDSIT